MTNSCLLVSVTGICLYFTHLSVKPNYNHYFNHQLIVCQSSNDVWVILNESSCVQKVSIKDSHRAVLSRFPLDLCLVCAWLRRWVTPVWLGIASAVAHVSKKNMVRRMCSMATWSPRMEISPYCHHVSFYRRFLAESSVSFDCFIWMTRVLWIRKSSVLEEWISSDCV